MVELTSQWLIDVWHCTLHPWKVIWNHQKSWHLQWNDQLLLGFGVQCSFWGGCSLGSIPVTSARTGALALIWLCVGKTHAMDVWHDRKCIYIIYSFRCPSTQLSVQIQIQLSKSCTARLFSSMPADLCTFHIDFRTWQVSTVRKRFSQGTKSSSSTSSEADVSVGGATRRRRSIQTWDDHPLHNLRWAG